MNSKSSKHYDVIVIGAGVSGLTCAAAMAKKGFKVMLCEKHNMVGGYCTSFYRKDYMFDSADHFINGCHPGEILGEIFDQLGIFNEVEFYKAPISETLVFRDMTYKVPNDFLEFKEKLINDFHQEMDNINQLFNILEILNGRDITNPIFIKYYMMPYSKLLEEFIKDNRLYNILIGGYTYIGNINCPSIFIAYLLRNSKYYPIGGMQVFSDAMAKVITKYGGEVMLKSKVSSILIHEQKAYGVLIENGDTYTSSIVVSSIDARKTYLEMIDQEKLPLRYINGIKKMEPSLSSFIGYFGVQGNLMELGLDTSLICIYDDIDKNKRMTQDLGYKPGEEIERLCMFTPSLKHNNAFSPKYQSIIANCFVPSQVQGGWKQNKNLMLEKIKSRIQSYIPEFNNIVDLSDSASPETLERYTGNSFGSSYGFDRTVDQTRAYMKIYSPPVKNLYHIGHWSGGFYSGLSGSIVSGGNIANRISEQWGR